MKKLLWLVLVVLAGCPSRTDTRGVITGRVQLKSLAGADDYSRVRVDVGRGEGGTPVNDDGTFELADLEPDAYQLVVTYSGGLNSSASRSAYRRYERRVILAAGTAVNLPDIALELGSATVKGNIGLDGNGTPEDASVTLTRFPEDGTTFTGTVLEDGTFEIPDVEVSRYTMTASKAGHASSRKADNTCGALVTVGEDGEPVTATSIAIATTSVGLDAAADDLVVKEGSRWYAARANITFLVDAPFATLGRMWRDGEEVPGYGDFLVGGYPLEGLMDDTVTRVHLQFHDACGYESEVISRDIVRDTSAPSVLDVTINGGQATTRERGLEVRVEATDLVDAEGLELRVIHCAGSDPTSETCVDTLEAEAFDTMKRATTLTLPDEQGAHTVLAQVRDRTGHVSVAKGQSIVLDSVPPSCSIMLTGRTVTGEPHPTATAGVVVDSTITCSSLPDEMALVPGDAAPDCATATYVAYVPSVAVTLLPGEGPGKQVQGCFRDFAGNASGPVASGTLVLDTTAPSGVMFTLHNGSGWWSEADVTEVGFEVPFTVGASESGVFVVDVTPAFSAGTTGVFSVAAGPTSGSITIGDTEGALQDVYVRVSDAVGNSVVTVGTITVDRTPPHLTVELNGGNVWVSAATDGNIPMALTAEDASSGVDGMAFVDPQGACPGIDAFQPFTEQELVQMIAPPVMDAPEGEYVVGVCVSDRAGNVSEPVMKSVTFDRTPPTVTSFAIDSNGVNVVRSPIVSLSISVDEGPGAKVNGIALGNAFIDCNSVRYEAVVVPLDGQLTRSWVLPSGDGPKSVFLCLRDEAGNVVEQESPIVQLDTLAPATGTLVVAQGRERINYTTNVEVAVSGMATDMTAVFSGNIVLAEGDDGVDTLDGLRTTLTLTPEEGAKTVNVVLVDAAGNPSIPMSQRVVVDFEGPEPGTVTIAGNQPRVGTQVVSVNISDTFADTLRMWEVASNASCGACECDDLACGGAAATPFAPSTTFTLTSSQGPKRICWQFCDLAGNGTAVASHDIELGTFLDRPRPVLTSTNTPGEIAFGPAVQLTATGTGFAHDTQMQIGSFLIPCTNMTAFSGCEAGNLSTCGTTCTVTVPSEIMESSGTYVVRIVTPAPVAGGNGNSVATTLFNVIAPTPVITRVEPLGVTQGVDANGQPVGTTINPLKIWGRLLMDNAYYSVGGTTGRVIRNDQTGPQGQRYVEVVLSTAGLVPDVDVQTEVVATNPPPGGGSASKPFGINPAAADCGPLTTCKSDLRNFRTRTGNRRAVQQGFFFQRPSTYGVSFTGGTAAGARDANGKLLFRTLLPHSGGAVPLPIGQRSFFVEDNTGSQPPVTLRQVARRGSGTLTLATGANGPGTGVPYKTVVGDVNEDGVLDVMIAMEDRNDASLYLGVNGTSVPTRIDVPISPIPWAIALADLNGDRHLDVITGGRFQDRIQVRNGNGDGTFENPVYWFVTGGQQERNLAVADLNTDGHADIIVAVSVSGIRVLMGTGDGRFAAPAVYAAGTGMDWYDVAVADLNADGIPDVVASGSGKISIRFGNGDGTLQTEEVLDGVGHWVRIADLNADGAPDIVTGGAAAAAAGTSTVGIRLWRGTGTSGYGVNADLTTFDTSTTASNTLNDFALQDMNGDGIVDIVCGFERSGQPGFRIVPGVGNGTFTTTGASQTGVARPFSLAVADFNGDGAPDVAGGDAFTNLRVAINTPVVSLGELQALSGADGFASELADMNRDGINDLVVSGRSSIRIFTMRADGTVNSTVSYPHAGEGSDLAVGDFNRDGHPDVVTVGNRTTNVMYVFFNNTTGGLQTAVTYPTLTYPWFVRAADMDSDGDADLVVLTENAATDVTVFHNDGNGDFDVTTPVNLLVFGPNQELDLVDLNNDGLTDILVGHENGGPNVGYRLQNANGTFAPAVTFDFSERACDVDHADLNNDGIVDLFGGTTNTQTIGHRFGIGDGTFGARTAYSIAAGSRTIALTDFNGDGVVDLTRHDAALDSLKVHLRHRNNVTTHSDGVDFPVPLNGGHLTAGDLNGDGIPDLIRPHASGTAVLVSPSPAGWTQELTDLPAPVVSAPTGLSLHAVHQASQYVEQLAVRVRLRDPSTAAMKTNLSKVTIELRSPNGDAVILHNATNTTCSDLWLGKASVLAHFPTTALCGTGNLSTLLGWQIEGDWTLAITNTATEAVELVDFAVITRGSFSRKRGDGRTRATAELIELVPGRSGAIIPGTTLGYPDNGTPACASGTGVGDHSHELVLSAAQRVTVSSLADFDSVVSLYSGPCATATSEQCDNDSGGGRSALVAGRYMPAGRHCVVVDGVMNAGRPSVGRYELAVRTGNVCDVAPNISASLNTGSITGSTTYGADALAGSCGGTGGNEVVYALTPTTSGNITVSTNNTGTTFDTVVHVRSSCANAMSEVACNDNGGTSGRSVATFAATAGTTYYIAVDGASAAANGAFVLTINQP